MTRKEVCRATGLSVKTLRLYEEKGLIAPTREYRNGREYREYTPELVEQLKRIATLRRALFTMDEIRTMQEHPEKIPDIFHDYQLWLESQERQIQQLRRAAGSIRAEALSSMEDLLSGLRGAAETMPLPAMDVKPNFKRLDELEEGPRLVRPQENFDETVPDAKVFRQVNLMLDRDKANNINIAFGQYNTLKKDLAQPVESGVVQRERKRPKWQRVTGSILTVLLLLCLVLFAVLTRLTRDYILWPLICAGILLAARVALAAVPAYLAHRAWLKKAQQEDLARQQKRFATDPSGYARERRKRRTIAAACTAGGLVIIALIVLLCRAVYMQEHQDTDLDVCFFTIAAISDGDAHRIEAALEPLVGDVDGNGKTVVDLDQWLVSQAGHISSTTPISRSRSIIDYREFFDSCTYGLCLITNLEYSWYNICDGFPFMAYCQPLPDDLADPQNSCRADLTGTAPFAAAELEYLPVYGCIPKTAGPEEYDRTVALLRKLLTA